MTLSHKPAHPIVFFILSLPYGITTGLVQVEFGDLYQKAGVSTEQIALLLGSTLIPNIIKFIWAPLVDTTLSLKKWYVLTAILSAIGIVASGMLPVKESSLALLNTITVLTNIAVGFTYMVATGLAAHDTPHELRGKVGGYSQAGNIGGLGLGGGLGLWLAIEFKSVILSVVVLAIITLATCFSLFFVKEPVSTVKTGKATETLGNLFKDIWGSIKTKFGLLALILCFLPLGTGAISGFFSDLHTYWNASDSTVEIFIGVIGGLITSAGCLVGGWICDRMERQKAYIIFGWLNAMVAAGMVFSPHTEILYIIWTSIYAFTLGFCFAAFSAFVFEAIGKGAAGTKYTVFSSLSNAPIYAVTIAEGWTQTKFGLNWMFNIELMCALVATILFFITFKALGIGKLTPIET